MSDSKPSRRVGVASPCVRNCCLDAEDICAGCYRHIEEITGWAAMDDTQRLSTLDRCEQRRRQRGPNV